MPPDDRPNDFPDDFMAKFDRQSRPITDEQFITLINDRDYKHVLTTRIGDLACVMTIWDGYDPYRLYDDGPHLIFETTVFRPTNNPRGIRVAQNENLRWTSDEKLEQPRHATEAEARAWHHAIAEKIHKTER